MKKIFIFLASAMLYNNGIAQALYNNGASLTLTAGGSLTVNGNAQFQSGGMLANDGTLTISGNLVNNQAMTTANAGTVSFSGSASQIISGSAPYFAKDVILNNANGLTISTPLKIDGICNFVNGTATAASLTNAVIFTATGSVSTVNPAKDASHVNGYVVKEGTGNFIYPVGNGIKYQKTAVNLSGNTGGMRVKYFSADAGAAPFTGGGTEPLPPASYNNREFWDITPLAAATGTVTVFWDGYIDNAANPPAERRVAHKYGGNFLNEGNALTATGNTAAGSITSNTVNNWGAFALGSVINVLPVRWIAVSGRKDSKNIAVITWKVQEAHAAKYDIESSADAINFSSAGIVQSAGEGEHSYAFSDTKTLINTEWYRVKQTDLDGKINYSALIALTNGSSGISINPLPAISNVTLSTGVGLLHTIALLYDGNGRLVNKIQIINPTTEISLDNLKKGSYFLKFADGSTAKILKQ